MITGIIAIQDRGKTLLGVAMSTKLQRDGYKIISTVALPLIPHTQVSIADMKNHLTNMVDPSKRRIVYFVDEINRVFPARGWQHKTQTDALAGLWQDEKLDIQLIYTAHTKKDPFKMVAMNKNVGELLDDEMTGIDKMVREATRMVIYPMYQEKWDLIDLLVHDYRYDCTYTTTLYNASDWFSSYDRWAVVV